MRGERKRRASDCERDGGGVCQASRRGQAGVLQWGLGRSAPWEKTIQTHRVEKAAARRRRQLPGCGVAARTALRSVSEPLLPRMPLSAPRFERICAC